MAFHLYTALPDPIRAAIIRQSGNLRCFDASRDTRNLLLGHIGQPLLPGLTPFLTASVRLDPDRTVAWLARGGGPPALLTQVLRHLVHEAPTDAPAGPELYDWGNLRAIPRLVGEQLLLVAAAAAGGAESIELLAAVLDAIPPGAMHSSRRVSLWLTGLNEAMKRVAEVGMHWVLGEFMYTLLELAEVKLFYAWMDPEHKPEDALEEPWSCARRAAISLDLLHALRAIYRHERLAFDWQAIDSDIAFLYYEPLGMQAAVLQIMCEELREDLYGRLKAGIESLGWEVTESDELSDEQ